MRIADQAALLEAIRTNPTDDLPRLVFADFLEESGHPAHAARAAYIRLQLDAAPLPDGPDRLLLTRQAAELRPQFRDETDAALATLPTVPLLTIRERGFVTELRGTALSLRSTAAPLFQVAPITRLRIETFDQHTDWLRSAICLRSVTQLKIGPMAWDAPSLHAAEPLLATRHFRHVQDLDLSHNLLGNHWLLAFVPRLEEAALSTELTTLDLSRNQLTDPAAMLLATARALSRLQILDVTENRFTAAGIGWLRRRFGPGLRA